MSSSESKCNPHIKLSAIKVVAALLLPPPKPLDNGMFLFKHIFMPCLMLNVFCIKSIDLKIRFDSEFSSLIFEEIKIFSSSSYVIMSKMFIVCIIVDIL